MPLWSPAIHRRTIWNPPAERRVKELLVTPLLLLAILPAAPELAVVLVPNELEPGQEVVASIVGRNPSDKLISMCRAGFQGRLAARAGIKVFRPDGQRVYVGGGISDDAHQVFLNLEVTSDSFADLRPGASASLWRMSFNAEIGDGGPPPSGKNAYGAWEARSRPLAPGTYTVVASYGFQKPTPVRHGDFQFEYEYTPTAKAMLDRSFVGQL